MSRRGKNRDCPFFRRVSQNDSKRPRIAVNRRGSCRGNFEGDTRGFQPGEESGNPSDGYAEILRAVAGKFIEYPEPSCSFAVLKVFRHSREIPGFPNALALGKIFRNRERRRNFRRLPYRRSQGSGCGDTEPSAFRREYSKPVNPRTPVGPSRSPHWEFGESAGPGIMAF